MKCFKRLPCDVEHKDPLKPGCPFASSPSTGNAAGPGLRLPEEAGKFFREYYDVDIDVADWAGR